MKFSRVSRAGDWFSQAFVRVILVGFQSWGLAFDGRCLIYSRLREVFAGFQSWGLAFPGSHLHYSCWFPELRVGFPRLVFDLLSSPLSFRGFPGLGIGFPKLALELFLSVFRAGDWLSKVGV